MFDQDHHKFERKRSVMVATHERLVIGKPTAAVILSEFDDLDGAEDEIAEDIRRNYIDLN